MLAKKRCRRWRSAALAVAMGCGIATPSWSQNPSSDSAFFFCKSRDFNIPFNIGTVGRMPSELELEVSADGGTTWKSAQRSLPTVRNFRYQAPADGFYLFRLRMIDAAGRSSLTSDAPLQVIIDTEKPTGELAVDIDPNGQLVASFFVVEPNLNVDSVKVEYRTEKEEQWKTVHTALRQGNETFEVRGTGSWDVPIGVKQLVVRLTAQDQAENMLEVFRYPDLPRTAQFGNAMQLASQRSMPRTPSAPTLQMPASPTISFPIANQAGNTGMNGTTANTNAPMVQRESMNAAVGTGALPSGAKSPLVAGKESNQADVPRGVGMTQATGQGMGASTGPSMGPSNVTNRSGNYPPIVPGPQTSAPRVPAGKMVLTDARAEDIVAPLPTSTSAKPVTEESPYQLPSTEDTASLDALGVKPYFSNSKAFSLDYDLEAHPAIGIQSIELWGTTDGGKTWDLWGSDPDRASPMDISVEDEGRFGFRIAIVSSSGQSSNRPIAGDTADMWIQVDTTMPVAKITSAQYGTGGEVGSLVLEYQAQDEFLAERPITFGFSDTPKGPWVTMATGISNSGRYVWSVEPNLPKKVYIRMEVMDQAGNVSVHVPSAPIDIQGLTPRGRIQGIRPIRNP